MSPGLVAHDPSAPDYRGTSPYEWGGKQRAAFASIARTLAALALAGSLSGCLVGPDYERPQPATAPTPEFKETSDSYFRPAIPRDAIDRGKWWSMYGDPALDQLAAQVDVSNQNLQDLGGRLSPGHCADPSEPVGALSDHRLYRLGDPEQLGRQP